MQRTVQVEIEIEVDDWLRESEGIRFESRPQKQTTSLNLVASDPPHQFRSAL